MGQPRQRGWLMLPGMTKISGVVVLLLALSLSGCSSSDEPQAAPSTSPTSVATTTTLDPDFEKPEVGACRQVSTRDIPPSTNDTPTVPCSQPHTAVTAAVVTLPAGMTYARHKVVLDFAFRRCQRAGAKLTGLPAEDVALSIFNYSWFTPTEAQQAAGARWVRCDLNAYTYEGGDDPKSIYDLPAVPLKGDNLPEDLRACFSGTDELITVSCSESHTFRSAVAFRHRTHGEKYPRRGPLFAIAEAGCEARLDGHVAWSYPSGWDWNNDWAWFTCYSASGGTSV